MRVALVYPRLFHQTRSFLVPLGLISLATVARDKGYKVRLFDPSFDPDLSRIKRELADYQPQVVGLSLSTDLYPVARELCAFAKDLGATTIMGGPHPTICAEEIWEDCSHLDIIVSGEGESTFLELLGKLEQDQEPEGVPGVAFRSKEEVITNEPSDWIRDVDSLPLPDRSLWPTYARYSASGYTGLVLTRGCPYKCSFCQPSLNKVAGRFRAKSAKTVANEVELLYRTYGNSRFHVDDDLFVLHRRWIAEIADELERRRLLGKVKFILLSRVDIFDEELALLLKRLGAYYVMFGVESGSQELLDSFEKKTTSAKIERAFALAHAHGFLTHAFLILGSPDETQQSLQQTEALVERLNPHSLFISQYAPLPGTKLRQNLEAEGRLNITSYEQMSYFSWYGDDLPIKISGVTYKDVIATRDRIISGRRGRFILPNIKELALVTAEKMSLWPLWLHARFFLKKRHFNG